MNDEIPVELQDFDFPELTNNQQNIWRLRDELNATRRWIRENAVSEGSDAAEQFDQAVEFIAEQREIRPGVRVTKNGRYYIPGKGFIKPENAFL